MTRWRPHRSVLVGALVLWGSACMAPEDFLPLREGDPAAGETETWAEGPDTDGDGLGAFAEDDAGTDPTEPDTDGDGWLDGEEVDAGTNPLWEEHHPFAHGDYPLGPCQQPPETDGAGPGSSTQVSTDAGIQAYAVYEPGDVVQNPHLVDQWGQEVGPWSSCGLVVWLIVAAEDSDGLMETVRTIPELLARHPEPAWTPVLVLTADHDGELPDADRLAAWLTSFGLDGVPVLAPVDGGGLHDLQAFDVDGLAPSTAIIGPDLQLLSVDDGVGLQGGPEVADWLAAAVGGR